MTTTTLVFDLAATGHHASYIEYLARHWLAHRRRGRLAVVVSPEFFERHGRVVGMDGGDALRFFKVDPGELPRTPDTATRPSRLELLRYSLDEWRVLGRYCRQLGAGHAVVMQIDVALQGPLALGVRTHCPVSGIYFRPTFHYPALTGQSFDLGDRVRALRQRALLWRAMRHRDLGYVFSLDPHAVGAIASLAGRGERGRALHLPDPVDIPAADPARCAAIRAELGVPSGTEHRDHKVLLLFGALGPRKGLFQVLEALPLLPAELAARTTLLLVGRPVAHAAERIRQAVAQAAGASPARVILHDSFVPEADVQRYFELADVVLGTYQRHLGSSGILIRAAAAHTPILASDYGLLGVQTREHAVGLPVDAASPDAIAAGLTRLLTGEPVHDPARMSRFAAANAYPRYAETLLDAVAPGWRA